MCRRIAKYGLLMIVLVAAGFLTGGMLTMAGYIGLWWEFPRSWQPLEGLSGPPQTLLAIQAPENRFLLRAAGDQLFSCEAGRCAPEPEDWSAGALACDKSTRPAVVSFFRVILSRDIEVALGCERGYQSTGRTVFVVYDHQGSAYWSGGPTMIPTDAGVLIVGILGGLVGSVAAVVLVGMIGVIRWMRSRAEEQGNLPAGDAI